MDREPPGWERQRLDGSAGKGAASSLCLVDDGLGWMGRCWRWCRCGKGVDRESDVCSSGWLAGLGCVSVWVIATGQERSPVHGAGLV